MLREVPDQQPRMSSPERAILSSQAALAALKRPQLVALAKSHGLKGSGKVRLAHGLGSSLS